MVWHSTSSGPGWARFNSPTARSSTYPTGWKSIGTDRLWHAAQPKTAAPFRPLCVFTRVRSADVGGLVLPRARPNAWTERAATLISTPGRGLSRGPARNRSGRDAQEVEAGIRHETRPLGC